MVFCLVRLRCMLFVVVIVIICVSGKRFEVLIGLLGLDCKRMMDLLFILV